MIDKNFDTLHKTLKINSIHFVFGFLFVMLASCSKSKIERNPYLGEVRFSYTINIDLPAYNALKYPQNTIYIPNIGIKGVFVTNQGNNRFVAWEAACPNRNPLQCERLKCASKSGNDFIACETDTKSYIFVVCPCDKTVYNLVNGSIIKTNNSKQQYPLLNYNISIAGNTLIVSN
ncbi:hypothetical protein [Capnocytophaga felis]|uniref:Rieske domain-containing protein n=1 Tax=Capnocytophaga felis TaxID=2267611 RepID=A0A5M4B5Y7_9FLAO|nr:hypothetical protein [Capnocytophaga felis]GET45031.1 hypothetical protein RCZ01_03330 [Capnocytophaga felis]GET47805.1 hypothetical protein RCZ02_06360 [Capnocytophaga felis]